MYSSREAEIWKNQLRDSLTNIYVKKIFWERGKMMKQKKDNRTSEKEKKDVMCSFRCTQKMSDQINKKAGQKDISAPELIEEYIETGLKSRQPRGLKAKVRVQVEVQEALNQALLKSNMKGAARNKITEILKETMPLWDQ